MSNNSRPYRATITGPLRTTHYDYPSKEERGSWSHTPAKFTTVTSRKPVTRGEPVCWVNVYEDSDGKRAGGFTHRTEGAAALSAGSAAIHCIPVYLPGEGAERRHGSGPLVPLEEHNRAVSGMKAERDAAKAEVERLKTALTETMAQRDAARAEVARLTAELAEARVTWGSAEIASLRKLYAAAMEVRSWFDPPKHVQNALIRAVHDHAEKFGKPTEQP